jgi:chromosome segregation ATPase
MQLPLIANGGVMSGSEFEQSDSLRDDIRRESAHMLEESSTMAETRVSSADANNSNPEPLKELDALLRQMEHFSNLSSEMNNLLSDLSRGVKLSMDRLHGIRAEVDLKKKELRKLHDIEVSATELDRLIEDHRLQRENLANLTENHRKAWEEEKARRTQWEKEYLENLKIQRQREEEEHRRMWALEQLDAKQKLEEELRAVQQKNLEKQESLERDWLERERILKEKELEWDRLMAESERFLSRLAARAQSRSAGQEDLCVLNVSLPSNVHEKNALLKKDTSKSAPYSENAHAQERPYEKGSSVQAPSSNPIFGSCFNGKSGNP